MPLRSEHTGTDCFSQVMHRKTKNQKSNRVRIIAGTHRSRVIQFPDQAGLRPTSDRIRETLFNWVQGLIENARCLDLFAGSGALGIEALSRGASHVQFVENSAAVANAIEENLDKLGLAQARVNQCTAEAWLQGSENEEHFDLVFIDPPYGDQKIVSICHLLQQSSCIQAGSKIYLENNKEVDLSELPTHWKKMKMKRAGQVHYYLFEVLDRD